MVRSTPRFSGRLYRNQRCGNGALIAQIPVFAASRSYPCASAAQTELRPLRRPRCTAGLRVSADCRLGYFVFFGLWSLGFRRRTPAPPPFSSMNSTPAVSNARRTARSLETVIDVASSVSSARRIVVTPSAACPARSSALHRSKARAARICADVSIFSFILTL
jgi:hypothetical protein